MSDHDLAGAPDAPTAPSSATTVLSFGRHAPDNPGPLGPAPHLDTVESETRHYRHDGWTPPARAAFLETLAKSGVVAEACREVQRSSQTAYALRNRDAPFAAGWDAALSMARARLADDLFHRSVNGTVDQVWKDGAIVAERHRHDNRLSIAVLNRLDARCDRAERIGAPIVRVAAQWDAYLAALAADRTADLAAMLAPAPGPFDDDDDAILGHGSDSTLIRQFHQLRDGKALDEEEDLATDDDQRVWIEDYTWRTNYPPPDGFRGDQDGDHGEEEYSRQCTPEECAVLDARFPTAFVDDEAEARRADEAERATYFAALAAEIEQAEAAPAQAAGDDPPGDIDSS